MATFITRILIGDLPHCVRNILLTSLLLPINKPGGGIRPIAIGELFVRIASRHALSCIDNNALQHLFLPHQFGVGVANGCETVVHTIQHALANTSERHFCMSVDFKNAFNCLNRTAMLTALFKHAALRPLWRFCHWCYSTPTNLAVHHAKRFSILDSLLSRAGCRQGSPESSLLFAITIQPLLTRLHANFPNIKIVAYLDDISLLGTNAAEVLAAYEFLSHEASTLLDLQTQPRKCQFIYFNHDPHADELDGQGPFTSTVTHTTGSARAFLESQNVRIRVDGAEILGRERRRH
jgi:hypothetical protein